MVSKKRSIALRAGVALLVIMLFFTFFSASINHFLSPTVTVAAARRGGLALVEDTVTGVIIPTGAIIDGSGVYVVNQADTFLGTELRAELRTVTVIAASMGQAAIGDGLGGGEYVVTSWDRPLKDGIRVFLPYD